MNSQIIRVASALHDAWRAPRQLADGSYEPRWKGDVDIANTMFADLPAQWQAENAAAAEHALEAVSSTNSVEEAAAMVHVAWLRRNAQWAPAEQALPYSDLSEVEKDKDRAVARLAASVAGVTLV